MSHVSFIDNFSQIGYITFINYNGSISTNLNKTMQTKQPAMIKKTRTYTRDYFCGERIFSRKFS